MRLAVIGAGISGLVAAYLLSPEHAAKVFEANGHLGGHSHTVDVGLGSSSYPVDAGFVVFNETTYPNFVKLLKRLGVSWQHANMSFSVTNARTGLEFGSRTVNGLFAQWRNLVRDSFYKLLYEGFSFLNKLYVKDLTGNELYWTKHDVAPLWGRISQEDSDSFPKKAQ